MKLIIHTRFVKTNYRMREVHKICDDTIPLQFALEMVADYNDTLEYGESPRELMALDAVKEKHRHRIDNGGWPK